MDAVVVEALRTPIGRYGGALSAVRPDDLLALAIKTIVERTGIDPESVDDVIMGCTNAAGEDNRNVARMSLLLAGLPVSVPGQTVNRLCGSGLQAMNIAAQAISSGQAEIVIAGGVESMSRSPFVMLKPESGFPRGDMPLVDTTIGWRFVNPKMKEMYYPYQMGETAENVAEKWKVSREDQDCFAFDSQQKTAAAQKSGAFGDEMIPVTVTTRKGETVVSVDEHPRNDTTMEGLAKLRPAFRKDGSVTAGNSSGINDGACATLIMSEAKAKDLGYKPLARFVATAVAGVDPAYMGVGPVPATRKALKLAGLNVDQLDWIELNEAFAAQSLAVIRDLELPQDRLNPLGGAIALGHPLGCSGARIATTLLHQMKRTNARYGLATMCIGVGQGIATVFERAA
ncbi:MAG TPA: acetyl-CoA C-acyltransferase [Chloroflexota bacterium]|nr:acetyl-CoA C-acyltransferase [Chloroflexota bacterium]